MDKFHNREAIIASVLAESQSGEITRDILVKLVAEKTGLEKDKVSSLISSMLQSGIIRVIKGGQGATSYYNVSAFRDACRAIEIKKELNEDQYGVWGEIRSILGREKRREKFGSRK